MGVGGPETTQALAAALGRGDAAAAAALYARDGKLLTPAAELIVGRAEIEAYWQAGIACGLTRAALELREVTMVGRVAIEVGTYELALDADGRCTVDRGKYLVLHRRLPGGTWRRAVDVYNPDAPETARRVLEEER